MDRITLRGKPISTNHAYKAACRGRFASYYMSAEAKGLKEDWRIQAKSQYKKSPLEGDLLITVEFYHSTNRKHDIDNYHKLLFDSLNGVLWKDDGQIIELITRKAVDKENPRVEVIVN
jgi:Holliday junction resolvase RusA-like endonuclease